MVRKSIPGQGDLFGAGPPDLPEGLVYVADFITPDQETALLEIIRDLPLHEAQYREYTAKRRTVSYGAEYDFSRNQLQPGPPVPPFLDPLRDQVGAWLGIPAADLTHALVTEYRPGTALGWHRDVPDFERIVGVSLLGSCRMRFRPYPPEPRSPRAFALDLEPRSAYVLQGDIRWKWQHSIPTTKSHRYSITFRTRVGRRSRGRSDTVQ
jgi:alkylated DNA repair dioxygenase AlkB